MTDRLCSNCTHNDVCIIETRFKNAMTQDLPNYFNFDDPEATPGNFKELFDAIDSFVAKACMKYKPKEDK